MHKLYVDGLAAIFLLKYDSDPNSGQSCVWSVEKQKEGKCGWSGMKQRE